MNGNYIFPPAPAGPYFLTVIKDGFKPVSRSITIQPGTNRIEVTLELMAIEEEIIVTGDASSVISINAALPQQRVNFPVTGRLWEATNRTPGMVLDLDFDARSKTFGATSRDNGFIYDNLFLLNAVDLNDNIHSGRLPVFIENASVERVEVLVSGISQIYGRFAGGVINAVTRTGDGALDITREADFHYAPGDMNAGRTPNIKDAAYGAASSTGNEPPLYVIDSSNNTLARADEPSTGELITIANLTWAPSIVGFDIATNGRGYAAVTPPGMNHSSLYRVDLDTGGMSEIGRIGDGGPVNFLTILGRAVTSTNNSGPGSLRQAITDANNTPGMDTIIFNIGAGGVQTIRPLTPLPGIIDPLILDATTQPGFTGMPVIELDGSNAGGGANGLTITAGNTTVKGFAIGSFGGHAISLQQGGNNRIIKNFLGADATGKENRGNSGEGVNIFSSNDNLVKYNTIVFNSDGGSIINSSGNLIRKNDLGTDATMTFNGGNIGAGFGFANATNNRFEGNRVAFNRIGFFGFGGGGNTFGGPNPKDGNFIGRNTTGMSFNNSNGNVVQSNYIGKNPLGEDMGNQGVGIELLGTSSNNKFGGDNLMVVNYFGFNLTADITAAPGTQQNAFLFNDYSGSLALPVNLMGNANGSQALPQISSATASSAETLIQGSLSSTPNQQFLVQIYYRFPSGPGGAPLGGFTLMTNPAGSAAFNVRVPAPLAGGASISAQATNITTNNTSGFSAPVTVEGPSARPDLELTKTGPETASCNDEITYTITVRNAGQAAAVGASVVEALPDCLELVDPGITSSQGFTSPTGLGAQITRLVRIDPGGTATITIKARLGRDCAQTIRNTATAFAPGDMNDSNDVAMVETSVACAKITGISERGKHVVVSGIGFQKGDQIEINGVFAKKTKFIDIDELLGKKGKKQLLPCDPANPGRMNVIRVFRPSSSFQPVQDTRAFATCP
jgi:uncharacterized repeat protein (TIGR01451 family)